MLFPSSLAVAQTKSAPDFSAGFEKLLALGISELPAGAKWSVLPQSGGNFGELTKGMKGSGWLIGPGTGGGEQAVLMGKIFPQEVGSDEEAEVESPSLLSRILGNDGKPKPAPTADLTKDIKTLCATIAKLKPPEDLDNFRSGYSSDEATARTLGPLLLFAAQVYQANAKNPANELATAIFQVSPSREPVIDTALDTIGEQSYERATTAFFETKDWKTYHQTLEALVKKLPRGWGNRQAVASMLPALVKRVAGEPPPTPRLEGVEIEAEALQSVAWMLADEAKPDANSLPPEFQEQLLEVPANMRAKYIEYYLRRESGGSTSFGNWLLQPEAVEKSAPQTAAMLQLGVRALPVLAALLEDSYLLTRSNPNAGGSRSYYSGSDPFALASSNYDALSRPATRSDFARVLIMGTLPAGDEGLHSTEAEDLRELAVEFWKQHRKDSREDLALVFLRDGSSEQKVEASQMLATSTDPAKQQAFEKAVLDDPSPITQADIVKTYVTVRKGAAKAFAEQYLTALRAEVDNGIDFDNSRGISYELRQPAQIEAFMKNLRSQVSGQSPQARAKEIAKGPLKEARAAIPSFVEGMSKEPPRKLFIALLAGADAAEDVEIRAWFLGFMFRANANEDGKSRGPRRIPPDEAKTWQRLLDDPRELPESVTRGLVSGGKTIAELAAFAMENSVDKTSSASMGAATIATGKTIGELCLLRARARLEGQPIPPLPDAAKVSRERLVEIVGMAAQKQPKEIRTMLFSLTDDERAAWAKWFAEPGDPAVPDSVKQARSIIVSRDDSLAKDSPGILGIDVGIDVNEANLRSHLESLAGNIQERSRCFVNISQVPLGPGLQISSIQEEMPVKQPETEDGADQEDDSERRSRNSKMYNAVVSVFDSSDAPAEAEALMQVALYQQGGGRWAENRWFTGGKVKVTEAAQDPYSSGRNSLSDSGQNPEKAKPPLPALAEVIGSEKPFRLTIQVLTRADAVKIKEAADH